MDQVPNTFDHLFIGYTVIWCVLTFGILSIVRKVRALEKRVEK